MPIPLYNLLFLGINKLTTMSCKNELTSVVSSLLGDYSGRMRGGRRGMRGGAGMRGMFDGGMGMATLMGLQGGGMGREPAFIQNILGSSISGRPLMAGEILGDGTALPRHGGTRDPSGLSMGWGNNPSLPMVQDGWSDPLRGMAFPTGYAGEELVFDSGLNQYVIAKHNAKKTMGGAGGMAGGVIGGGSLIGGTNIVHEVNKAGASGIPAIGATPFGAQTGHISAKQTIGQAASLVDQQTFGGVSRGDPFANQVAANLAQDSLHVAKKTVGMASNNAAMGGSMVGGGMVGGGMIGGSMIGSGLPLGAAMPLGGSMQVANPALHNMAKTNAMIGPIAAGKPAYNKMMGGHVPLSGVSAGTLGVHHPGVIAHNVGKATLGADAMFGHQIAKSANVPTGTGFMNPATAFVGQSQMIGSAAHLGGAGVPFMGNPMGAANMGMVGGLGRTNVVHEVNKAGASGIPAIGATPFGAQTGHISAKQTIGQAASLVDQQTFGGVSRGDPFANQVAANLAQDSLHVAKKTVGMASNNAAMGGIHMGGGMVGGGMVGGGMVGGPMIGGPMMGGPMMGGPVLPIASKGIVRPKGYGGRSRF